MEYHSKTSRFGDCHYLALALLICGLFTRSAFAADSSEDTVPPPQPSTNAPVIKNLSAEGSRLLAEGDYAQAKLLLQKVLSLCEKELPPNHPKTGAVLNDLGNACKGLGDYTNALIFLKRALSICTNSPTPESLNTAVALYNIATVYSNMGNYVRAQRDYERALLICEKISGLENINTATIAAGLADLYFTTSRFAEAEPFYEWALSVDKNATGPQKPNVAGIVNKLVFIYETDGQDSKAVDLRRQFADVPVGLIEKIQDLTAAGRYHLKQNDFAQAEKLFQQALAMSRDDLRTNQLETATCLGDLATLYNNTGELERAEPLFQEALDLEEKAPSPQQFRIAASLNNLANVCTLRNEYSRAEPLLQRAVSIDEAMLGPDNPTTASLFNDQGLLYLGMGDYGKARPLLEKAVSIDEKVLGQEHLETATCLASLAAFYDKTADYDQAEAIFQRVLKIRENLSGLEHPDTLGTLFKLASLYNEMAAFAKAEVLTQEIWDRSEKVISAEDVNAASCLCQLAGLYTGIGDNAKAEQLYQKALRIDEKIFDPVDGQTINTLNSLGQLYLNQGDFAQAEPVFQRALEMGEQMDAGENPYIVVTLNCLGGLRRNLGDLTGAAPLYERALKIDEKIYGTEHSETAATLNNLAALRGDAGKLLEARHLYERSLLIEETNSGAHDPRAAVTLNNLAVINMSLADFPLAEQLFQQALTNQETFLRPDNPDLAATRTHLGHLYELIGDYAKAEPLYLRALTNETKTLGSSHPQTIESLMGLGLLYLDSHRIGDAMAIDAELQEGHIKQLANVLSFASEQERLAFQAHADPYALPAAVTNVPELTLAILRNKGVVLDSLLEDRAVAQAGLNQTNRNLIDELSIAKRKLAQLVLSVPADTSEQALQERSRERENLTAQVGQLEGALAQNVAGLSHSRRALAVTLDQIQAAIPPDAALLEMIRYPRFIGKDVWEECYGVAVLGRSGEPKWVSLGNAASIERDISQCQAAVRHWDSRLHSDLYSLYQRIWAPIEPLLPPGTRTVILCPDAALNFLSFATLLAPDERFLAEKYSIRYVASGRDLLQQIKPSSNSDMVIFADPDFTAGETTTRSTAALKLYPLPYLATNAVELAGQAGKWHWPVQVFHGSDATEARLRMVQSPRILHLSTHGFFLPENIRPRGTTGIFTALTSLFGDFGGPQKMVVLQNPMYRSGVALAGAQTTLDAWSRGETPPTDNDGILTAEEAADLHLENTWLVTLSACDTGVGQWVSGEGVMGLRRGFAQAGTQNLLMTLWPVFEKTSSQFMLDFYTALQETGNAPKALADVQRDWLVKVRKKSGLSPAVVLSGPYILTSQGPIQ